MACLEADRDIELGFRLALVLGVGPDLQRIVGHFVDGGLRDELRGEQRLHDRRRPWGTLDPQGVDHLFERQILMREILCQIVTDPGRDLPERQVWIDIRPDDDGIDEITDDTLHLGRRTVGVGRAGHDVPASAQLRQEHEIAAHQDRKRGRAQIPRKGIDPRFAPFAQRALDELAAVAGLLTSWPIGRQVEHRRQSGEPATPIGNIAIELSALQQRALRRREVDVLDGHGRQRIDRRTMARLAIGRVQSLQLHQEYLHRPSVERDVMDVQEQDVVVVGDPRHGGPKLRGTGKIEGHRAPRQHHAARHPGQVFPGHARQIDDRECERLGRLDHLVEFARVVLLVIGAQDSLPRDDVRQRSDQRDRIGIVFQPKDADDRVDRAARTELIQDPELLLSERRRSAHHRGQGHILHRRDDRRGEGGDPAFDLRRQIAHGRTADDFGTVDLASEFGAQVRRGADRGKRGPADFKEPIPRQDRSGQHVPDRLQHLSGDAGH